MGGSRVLSHEIDPEAHAMRRQRRHRGRPAPGRRCELLPRRLTMTIAASLCLCLAVSVARVATASASPLVVDGITEENLTSWPEPFSATFGETWFNGSHITNARKILYLQWGQSEEHVVLEAESNLEPWLRAVSSRGLTPDIAPTIWFNPDEPHPTQEAYYNVLVRLLQWANGIDHIAYVEPWNEPNVQGGLGGNRKEPQGPELAAGYANQAYTACEANGCTVIAGDFDDVTGEMKTYEEIYTGHLTHRFADWGIHPYFAVNAEFPGLGGREWRNFKPGLRKEEMADTIWITEVSAYKSACNAKHELETVTEWQQAEAATRLVDTIGPELGATHAFYYEPVWPESFSSPCGLGQADNALYVEAGDPNTRFSPRLAAAIIFNDTSQPWAYTAETATNVTSSSATLSGSVYPGDVYTEARYHFEYGTSKSYGKDSAEAGAEAGLVEEGSGERPASIPIGELQPGIVYYYRLVAWNNGGTSYGSPQQFTTLRPPETRLEPPEDLEAYSAVLKGAVNPEGDATDYRFEYGTTRSYGSSSAEGDAGAGTGWVGVSARLEGLAQEKKYYFRLTAWSSGGNSSETTGEFTTPPAPPYCVTGPVEEVHAMGAVLTGTVNPAGHETRYYFEYGTSRNYGSHTAQGDAGTGTSSVGVRLPADGLTPETKYDYRLLAWSSAGTCYGETREFTTEPQHVNPEYKTCVRAFAMGSGAYNNTTCTEESKRGENEGEYELAVWNAGRRLGFTGRGGALTVTAYAKGSGIIMEPITCRRSRSAGEITGPKESSVTITLMRCRSDGKSCTSAGAGVGDIDTKVLTESLIYVNKKAHEAGIRITGRNSAVIAEFSCSGSEWRWTGAVDGEVKGDVDYASRMSEDIFKTNANGENIINREEDGTPAEDVLHTEITGGSTFESGWNTTLVAKGKENIEVAA